MSWVAFCLNPDVFLFFKDTVAATDEEPTETTTSEKREERLRKFRELHFKRVSCYQIHFAELNESGIHLARFSCIFP